MACAALANLLLRICLTDAELNDTQRSMIANQVSKQTLAGDLSELEAMSLGGFTQKKEEKEDKYTHYDDGREMLFFGCWFFYLFINYVVDLVRRQAVRAQSPFKKAALCHGRRA